MRSSVTNTQILMPIELKKKTKSDRGSSIRQSDVTANKVLLLITRILIRVRYCADKVC